MKQHILALAAAAAFVAVPGHAQQKSIVVGVYGGIAQKAITTCVFEPFTKATGVRVIADPAASAVTLNKLVAQKASPTMDVAYVDGGVSEQALAAGVLEYMDPARIPNLRNLIDEANYRDNGRTYAASNGYYSFGLVYNRKLVKNPPRSWKDLANPEYKGQVALPSPSLSMGLPFIVHDAVIHGGSVDNLDPGIAHLKKVDAVAYYTSAGQVSNMLQSEEVAIAPHFSTSALELIKGGAPLEFVIPTDKAIGNDFRIHLVRNGPNRALGEQLINTSLTPEAAACLADKFNAGPPVKGVKLPAEVAKNMPWGPTGSIDNLSLPDWRSINARREELVKKVEGQLTRR